MATISQALASYVLCKT